jgi:deazaflavin-dependent oxidoreductase (nitroreductase family)
MSENLQTLAGEAFCYLTTTGRVTGRPHEIEIWFALDGRTLYMLSGGGDRADWVRNLRKNPAVCVRIGGATCGGQARVLQAGDEDALARRLVVGKYQPGYGEDLSDWGRTSLAVAVDLE